jgi:F-type H+-transporting ATPase subunit b
MHFFGFYIPTFIFAALNLLVLYLILKKILFKPVTNFMENRTRTIKESLENAETQRNEAGELRRKYEEQLKSARVEGEKIIAESRAKAEREHDTSASSARKEAEGILAQAREEIEREHEQMLKEIRGQVAGIALAAASKVIQANMDTESNRVLVDKFMNEAGVA